MASRKEYEMLFQLNAQLGGAFNSTFNSAKSSLLGMQNQIQSLNKAQANISAYQKQQAAVEKTKEKLAMLQAQYANLKAEMDESGNASAAMKNQLLNKQRQIENTSGSLDAQTKKLREMDQSLVNAGVDTKNLASESARLEEETNQLNAAQEAAAQTVQDMQDDYAGLEAETRALQAAQQEASESAEDMGVSTKEAVSEIEQALAAAGIIKGVQMMAEGFKACVEASIAFESAMTGVDKTTDLSASELAAMSAQIKELSTEIPVTTGELAGIGEVAGQLGIGKDSLLDFTEVMAMLATATTMTAEEGATMLAQFANITQMDPAYYSNLASTIVALGNNYATAEQRITEMSQGVAASASIAGMSEAEIAALSAAVTSLGIETQAGSTSMSTMISKLNTAVETGEGLIEFAKVANMSAGEFKRLWGEDAATALASFITGLNDTERIGKSATLVLSELGITETRMQRMMLSLAGSGDLLNNTLATARTAWSENTALIQEAEKRYATTESRLQMLGNAFDNVKIAIGDNFTPVLQGLAPVATEALSGFAHFIGQNPALVQAVSATAAVFAVATAGLTGYAAIARVASAASTLLTSTIPGLKTILLVTAGISGLAGVITAFSSASRDAQLDIDALRGQFSNLDAQLQEQNNIESLCEQYRNLQVELSDTSSYRVRIQGIEQSAKSVAQLNGLISDLNENDSLTVTISPEVREKLADSDLLESGTTKLTLTPDVVEKLESEDFVIATGENGEATLYLRGEVAGNGAIDVREFVDGADAGDGSKMVSLSAQAAQALLSATELLDGTEVTLSGIPSGSPLDADKLVTKEKVPITGKPGDEMLRAEDLVEPDPAVTITPQLGDTTAIEASIAQLTGYADAAAEKLAQEKAKLDEYQSAYQEAWDLYHDGKASNDKGLPEKMAELTPKIEEQQGVVAGLQTTYNELNAQLDKAKVAQAELSEKQAQSASIMAQLNESSGGYITALGEDTQAVLGQVNAYEQLAIAKQEALKAQMYDNLASQFQAWGQLTESVEEYQAAMDESSRNAARATGENMSQAGAIRNLNDLIALYDELDAAHATYAINQGALDPAGIEASAGAFETLAEKSKIASEYVKMLTGQDWAYTGAESLGQLYNIISQLNTTDANAMLVSMGEYWSEATAEAASYGAEIESAISAQDQVAQSLIAMGRSGQYTTEELGNIANSLGQANGLSTDQIQAAMAQVRDSIDGAAAAADGYADSAAEAASAEAWQQLASAATSNIDTIEAAWIKAYESAQGTVSKLFTTFEKPDTKVDKEDDLSADQMTKNLESQAQYMEQYSEALAAAQEKGVNTDLLSGLADGSAESLAQLQTLATASEEDIARINAAYQSTNTASESMSAAMASIAPSVITAMNEAVAAAEQGAKDLDQSSEAKKAAEDTVQGYINGIEGKLSALQTVINKAASLIKSAFSGSMEIGSPSRVFDRFGEWTMAGFIGGVEGMESEARTAMSGVAKSGIDAFMSGEAAALNQPMYAQAVSAQGIEALSTDGNTVVYITISPTYSFVGVTETADMDRVLREHDATLREMVEEVLDERGIDAERRTYK